MLRDHYRNQGFLNYNLLASSFFTNYKANNAFKNGEYKKVKKLLQIDLVNNPNDSVMVVILFNGLYTDVNENIASNFNISEPYPNPANNNVSFNYNYDGIRDAQLNIYTIVGSLVKEIKLTNNAGSLKINTSELEEGFYFYKLTSENREIESGKFIIKH